MGEPLTNCHTCGWDDRDRVICGPIYHEDDGSDDIERWLYATAQDDEYPPKTATGCPGWSPKPAAIPPKDHPGPRPNVDRAQVAALGVTDGPTLSAVLEQFEPVWGEDPPPRPPPEAAETITVKRAEWDATLARIDALESRVGEVERTSRAAGARIQATMRRDRLRRGGR